ncbi:MAG TPA: MFS transporter [Thermoplasmata archaeon]|nr:MFS transporter [Thermoplasmata archaeon]
MSDEPTGTPEEIARHRALGAVFGATFFVRFAFGITLAVFAEYLTGHPGLSGNDVAVVGLVSGAAPVGEFSTVLLSGIVADRRGRFPVLFGGIAGAAGLFAVVAVSRSPFVLGGVNFLFGIASGAILAASLAVIADRAVADERGHEMGRFDAVNLSGWIGGFAFGLVLLDLLPDRFLGLAFVIGAGLLAGGLALAAALARGLVYRRPAAGQSVGHILRTAFRLRVLLVTLPWLVIYMLIGFVLVFVGTAAKSSGLPLPYLAAAIGGGGAILVLTQPRFGRLADRFGRRPMMTIGASGFVGVMVCASLLVAYGSRIPLLAATGVCVLLALVYGPAALAALADLSARISRATTMAVYSLTISLGMWLGLIVGTQLYDRLGNEGLYFFFGTVAVGLVALTAARYAVDARDARAGARTPAQ